MKRFTTTACCLAMLAAMVGCSNDKDRDSGRPKMSQRELMNRSKLEAYPDQVQASFMRDYPTAQVTSVDVYNDPTGNTMYEVNFAQDGRMSDAVYNSEGMRMTTPSRQTDEMRDGRTPMRDPAAPRQPREPMDNPPPPRTR